MHIARGSTTGELFDAGRRTWQVLGTACLVIALGIGMQAPAVEAAESASTRVWLHAQQVGAKRTICVGDTVQIRLSVNQSLGKRPGVNAGLRIGRVTGVNVAASVFGGNRVGSVSPLNSTTSTGGNPPGATYFAFHAERPGIAVIDFTARVPDLILLGFTVTNKSIKTQIQFVVEQCKYQVSATSTWRVPGEAKITLMARIQIAGLVEDGGGHYSGTARVQWIVSLAQVGDCQGSLPPDSQASVQAQVYGPDEMIVQIDYETAHVPLVIDCGGAGGTRDIEVTPVSPLAIRVPPSGGQQTREHGLQGPEMVPGQVTAVVKRAKN